MCTSFASYFNKPLYAMNFDYPETEFKLSVDTIDEITYFIMAFKVGEMYVNTVGMNSNGLFVSLQMLPDDNSEIIDNNSNNFPAMLLLNEVLKKASIVDDVLKIIDGKRFVVLRKPKGHALIADKTGTSVIIEEGKKGNYNNIIKNNGKFMVMTNFRNSDFINKKYDEVSGIGADRYIKAYEMLNIEYSNFDIHNGLKVLQETSVFNGDFQTLFSAVFNPEELCVYIASKRDYENIWKLSLENKNIEKFSASVEPKKINISNTGILSMLLNKE